MDNIINFLLLIICLVIILTFLFNSEAIEKFSFSANDLNTKYHNLTIKQRRKKDIFIEDDSQILKNPRKNNVLRDVEELMNFEANGQDIYDLTSANTENKEYVNNMAFW